MRCRPSEDQFLALAGEDVSSLAPIADWMTPPRAKE